MEKGNQPSSDGEAVMQANGGGTTATATRGGGTSTTDPRFINEDGSPKTPGQLRDEALAHRASADAAGGDLGGGIRSSFLGWAAEFEAHADALEQGQMLGAGSTGAPTTDSGVWTNTPDGLRQQGRDLDSWADGMQSRLDASIASGDVDADQVAEKQAFIDKYREQATKMRATADAPPPEAAHTGPTGEVVTEDGTRRGVDESGRPYEADASGD